MVLAAAALAQASEGDRPAKSEAGAAVPPSAEVLQTVASAGNVERRPAPGNSCRIAPANAVSAGSPTGTRIAVAAHQRAVPKPTITLHDAAAIVRQGYGGNVVDSAHDAAVVDLGLPKLDGISLIKTLRGEGKTVPVLILTARGGWRDKVLGLESGADDYLAKPFHMEELLARIKVLIRRAAGYATAVLDCGPLRLDTSRKEVRVDGALVELTAFEYRMLEYLALNPSRVVPKAELTDHLYEQDYDRDSNVIEVFVGRLRRKLDPQGRHNPSAPFAAKATASRRKAPRWIPQQSRAEWPRACVLEDCLPPNGPAAGHHRRAGRRPRRGRVDVGPLAQGRSALRRRAIAMQHRLWGSRRRRRAGRQH